MPGRLHGPWEHAEIRYGFRPCATARMRSSRRCSRRWDSPIWLQRRTIRTPASTRRCSPATMRYRCPPRAGGRHLQAGREGDVQRAQTGRNQSRQSCADGAGTGRRGQRRRLSDRQHRSHSQLSQDFSAASASVHSAWSRASPGCFISANRMTPVRSITNVPRLEKPASSLNTP
ncbi:MAG: hypothetical protein JWR37_4600 [Mycobacterium sp.]|nr:hypothetical protein [Mycobacterium sp.]